MEGMDSQPMYLLFGGKSVVGRGIFSYITYGILPHAKVCPTDGVIFSWNGETIIYVFLLYFSVN
jgi:hypothetical protein